MFPYLQSTEGFYNLTGQEALWSSLEAQVQEGWHLLFLSEPGDGLVVTREKSTA